ncbi:prepilin-type N-terminal cleavage/methylation domain-containing protein [Leptospira sp. 96542]|nr:prepilin-type N-terminal cleavage/methylation domain-containing protein [Leptospira sp. 96542]
MITQLLSVKRKIQSIKNKTRDGLTLIEIVVVISILGLLMVIVGGMLRNFLIPTTEDIAKKLQESFRFGYNKAQLTNQAVLFRYDFTKAKYQFYLLKREEGGLEEEPILKEVSLPFYSKIVKVRDLGGKPISEGELKIIFTPQGTTTDTFIYLGTESTVKKTIQLYRYAGRVKVFSDEYFPDDDPLNKSKITYGLDERDEKVDPNANPNQFR